MTKHERRELENAIRVLQVAKKIIKYDWDEWGDVTGICIAVGEVMGFVRADKDVFVDKYCNLPKKRTDGYCWPLTEKGQSARLRHLDKCIAKIEKQLKANKK